MARLSQLFLPKEREFYDLLEEAAANIVKAAAMLETMMESWPERAELARERILAEQEGDRITHDIIHKLNATFVTPIDREDILALASGLDDILDFTEEVADFLGLYRIEAPMDQAIEMSKVLHGRSPRRCRGCAPRRTCRTSWWRSTASRTTATGSSGRRSPRSSSARSTPWS